MITFKNYSSSKDQMLDYKLCWKEFGKTDISHCLWKSKLVQLLLRATRRYVSQKEIQLFLSQ